MRLSYILACLLFAAMARSCAVAEESIPAEQGADEHELRMEALSRLNPLIGEWRGVGRPQRYRTEGTWRETADWIWVFEESGPTLQCTVSGGKELMSAELSWDSKEKQYSLVAKLPDIEESRKFVGDLSKDGKKLLLTSPRERNGDVHQVRITMLNPKRTLLLFQKQIAGLRRFGRVSEVGYTRQGTHLAKDSIGGPECIVTGGLGTIEVKHGGETYYVCCAGCRDVFNDAPAETLKAHRERVAKRRAIEAAEAKAEAEVLGDGADIGFADG